MKKLFVGVLFIAVLAISCKKESKSNQEDIVTQINKFPIETLSNNEMNAILFLREEEKLAHDVYVNLYSKWNNNIFNNIADSELTHANAVLVLINKYGLIDPVGNNSAGVFKDSILQNLYDSLTAFGSISELNSLLVGAEIEDLDIADIMKMEAISDNQDLIFVLQNLKKGSRNHIRSFNEKLIAIGNQYVPKFISQSLFNEIVNSPRETGGW